MTQQELEARIAALEARMSVTEEIEDIKRLMALYEECHDSLERTEEEVALFTEDGKFVITFSGEDVGKQDSFLGAWEGKEGLRKLFSKANPKTLSYVAHHITNPSITVEGEKANGKWYLICCLTRLTPEGPVAVWQQGTYDNDFVKIDGKWKIRVMRFNWNFHTPHEDGWAKTKMWGT